MNAFALHDVSDQATVRRWGASAFAIVATHAVLVALALNWHTQRPIPGVSMPAIMVDMAPVSTSPQPTPLDLAPGPVMQEADASPPERAIAETVEEQIAPTPPQEKPEAVAPPEQKTEPPPPKPEPAQVEPEKKLSPVKPKVVRADAKKPTEAPPAPRTTAPPRAERQAPAVSVANSGASAAAVASYNQQVLAHLRRFKQYPREAQAANKQGVGRVNFTLSRTGQVLASRLAGSTGHPILDAESLASLRRAQPFPPFPPDMKQSSISFTMPVSFGLQ